MNIPQSRWVLWSINRSFCDAKGKRLAMIRVRASSVTVPLYPYHTVVPLEINRNLAEPLEGC